MIYILRFLPEAEDDAFAAYAWYEERAQGLGDEFLRMFYAGANQILRSPLLYPKVYGEFRRRLVRRFPYAIYFRMEHNEITVFALFHCARDPQTIGVELRTRRARDTH